MVIGDPLLVVGLLVRAFDELGIREISERQWGDVRGIVEIQGERLDRAYLATWSGPLGVADLLERALARG